MKLILDKIYRNVVALGVTVFFAVGLLSNCAHPLAPQGGPVDSLPPRILSMTPGYGKVDFDEKKIVITLDEYIKITDQQKEFFTSPFMAKKPTLTVKGKTIQIDINDTLTPNTTYAFDFGSSIRDVNENNPLYNFRYVFSTGDHVDSMIMSGYTASAYSKDSMSKAFILFYDARHDSIPEYDSLVFKGQPDAVGRSQDNGVFIAENLKPIDYKIYALYDTNGNQQYEAGTDQIAFMDSLYNPAAMPQFRLWYDTMRHYVVADPQIYMRLFMDGTYRRQILSKASRPQQNRIELLFSTANPLIQSLTFEGLDSTQIITEYVTKGKDTINLWLNVPPETLPDTIKGEITYLKHDSIRELHPSTEQLRLFWKAFESARDRRGRERQEKEKAELEAAAEAGEEVEIPVEANTFKFTVEASKELNPEKNIPILFEYPLSEMDSSSISLIRLEDERRFRVRYTIEHDTANLRRWTIKAPWVAENKYQLLIPQGAITNIIGEKNDTLKAEFSILPPERFATIIVNVKGKTPQSRYVVQITGGSNNVLQEKKHLTSGSYTFRYLDPGTVRIRIIEDMNGNGIWDTGNLVERRQPERVEIFTQQSGDSEITTRMNWELTFELDMEQVFAPITMESVMRQLREGEAERMRKAAKEASKLRPARPNRNDDGTSEGGFGGGGLESLNPLRR